MDKNNLPKYETSENCLINSNKAFNFTKKKILKCKNENNDSNFKSKNDNEVSNTNELTEPRNSKLNYTTLRTQHSNRNIEHTETSKDSYKSSNEGCESGENFENKIEGDLEMFEFCCDTCSKNFASQIELQVHKENIHNLNEINFNTFEAYIENVGGELPFRCRLCGKGFSRKDSAKDHRVVHTGKRPHVCDVCEKSFCHRSALYQHKRSHSGIEFPKFPCKVCGKLFKLKTYLKSHAVIHTKERPYICKICGDTFRDKSARRKHLHAHSGIKPYTCETCGKCFGRKGGYKSHLMVHTKERPYVCTICGQKFRSSSNCERHARICRSKKTFFGAPPYIVFLQSSSNKKSKYFNFKHYSKTKTKKNCKYNLR